jgi:hypothetical protein
VPVAVSRSVHVRVKRVRQARLRWCVLELDARFAEFDCGSSIS